MTDNIQQGKHSLVYNWITRFPFWFVLISLIVYLSYDFNSRTLEQHTRSLALERGRYTFKMIEATRLWLAQHGVAYVVRDKKTPSNPYLDVPEKNITTPSGVELTAVNPAYMTRQLNDLLKEQYDLLVHLTSLMPINPGNKADEWETRSLKSFENDQEKEVLELIPLNKDIYARYMAPLFVKKPCMQCHEKQGYKVGDVRGGISVSFDYAPFSASTMAQQRNINIIHIAAWLALNLLAFVIIKLNRRHERFLETARDDAERLVQERTQELQKALSEIKVLKDIIPVCSYCHKIRDDEGAWEQIESYISKHSDTKFSHGICPDCMEKARKDAGLDDEL